MEGGNVLDGNVMRGPEKHDKKVGSEWARAYKAFYHQNKLARTRGGIKKDSNMVLLMV